MHIILLLILTTMDEIKQNLLAGLYVGILAAVFWVIFSACPAEGLILLAKMFWGIAAVVLLAGICAFHGVKNKIYLTLISAVAFVAAFFTGKFVGLDFLGCINLPNNLESYPESWLFYPIIGLLSMSLAFYPIMMYFHVEEKETVKERMITALSFLGLLAEIAIILVLTHLGVKFLL